MDAASNKRSREWSFKSHWNNFFDFLKKTMKVQMFTNMENKAIEANLSGLHSTSNQRLVSEKYHAPLNHENIIEKYFMDLTDSFRDCSLWKYWEKLMEPINPFLNNKYSNVDYSHSVKHVVSKHLRSVLH